jgi:hypothetical protein
MKPEDYKNGKTIIYRLFSKVGSLYEGEILGYSDSKKFVNIKNKNSLSQWHEIDSIYVVDTVENLKSESFTKEDIEHENKNIVTKEDVQDYENMIKWQKFKENYWTYGANVETEDKDDPSSDLASKKPFPFSNDPFISGFTVARPSEVCDNCDPRMTDEDWEDLTKQLYPDEYYPKNYAENNCMYYLEFFQNDRWKLYLRQTLSVPKFSICSKLPSYVLGEGKVDIPDMYSMYTYNNLKRIVDGLNLLPKLNEDLNPYPKMSSETFNPPQATTDYFEKYKKENNS